MTVKLKLFSLVTLCMPLLFATTIANASTLDGVSLIINKEPITLYDVYKYSQRFKLSKKRGFGYFGTPKIRRL